VIAELLTEIAFFIEHKPSFFTIVEYYIAKSPAIIIECAPFAMLIAILFSIYSLSKDNEIIAMLTSGISLFRVLIPIFIVSFLLSLCLLYFNMFVVPLANFQKRKIVETKITKYGISYSGRRYNLTITGTGDERYLFFIHFYDAQKKLMQGVNIFYLDREGNLKTRLMAKKALWEKSTWYFYEGEIYEFKKNGDYFKTSFQKKKIPLVERPIDFSKKQKTAREMNYVELKEYIRRLKMTGFEVRKLLVDLHQKIATPLGNFIIMFIGIPFALKSQRKGSIWLGFALSIFLYFAHWELGFVLQSLGYAGKITPFLSAWGANFTFLLIGIYMLFKTPT
jgi:lipopolysaccharide export system permease protein